MFKIVVFMTMACGAALLVKCSNMSGVDALYFLGGVLLWEFISHAYDDMHATHIVVDDEANVNVKVENEEH